MCANLTTNMSHQQWHDWVSPDIDYIKGCPDLPIAPDWLPAETPQSAVPVVLRAVVGVPRKCGSH